MSTKAERLKVVLDRMVETLANPITALRDVAESEDEASRLIDELKLRDASTGNRLPPVFGREFAKDDAGIPTSCRCWHTRPNGDCFTSFRPAHEVIGVALTELGMVELQVKDYRSAIIAWRHKLEDAARASEKPKAGQASDEFTPLDSDLLILEALAKRQTRVKTSVLRVPGVGERLKGDRLLALEAVGWVDRAAGKRSGWAITELGREKLRASNAPVART